MKAKWKTCMWEIFIINNTIQRGIQSFQKLVKTISAEVSLFELLHYGTKMTIHEADSHQGN
jgi:hypothetical protein